MADSGESDKRESEVYKVKLICLGDSAVGKSKLVERFLLKGYQPHDQSTYALTRFRYETKFKGKPVEVDIWDTAGQEKFQTMHASYYHQSHACIMVFDITRKVTYKNLSAWYKELRHYRPEIPCILVANKIDADYSMTQKSFNFPQKHHLPFYFVSASDGTNVVKVFREAIKAAIIYKENSTDFVDEVMRELEALDGVKSDVQLGRNAGSAASGTSVSSSQDND
ncbi:rab-like protein 2A [Corticium candelabrum]|uniref:rab-like protein 2A n=1 Tax=Corticium candelabrum TaxID=121492 RepID=UPI002E309009|nr:rab-like protein 2A [Corticium candelabrum]